MYSIVYLHHMISVHIGKGEGGVWMCKNSIEIAAIHRCDWLGLHRLLHGLTYRHKH